MFTPEDRDRLRAELIKDAQEDSRLTGVAMTGSAAGGREDRWSDIDLAFGVSAEAGVQPVLEDWSRRMYQRHGCLHDLDVPVGNTIYRVFFLANTLQVDLAFSPEDEFGARAPTFKLLSGKSVERPRITLPSADSLVGMAWLYAIHVRSSIARGKVWQAEYMIGTVRRHVLELACLRYEVPVREGRGFDQLPADVLGPMEKTLVTSLEHAALTLAFAAVTDALLTEIRCVDQSLASRLQPALLELVATAGGSE